MNRFFVALFLVTPLAGCNPHVVIEQPKPLEININFTGHLDLVIHDARQNLEEITGEKAPNGQVSPEAIGLPPAGSGSAVPTMPVAPPRVADAEGGVFYLASYTVAADDDLKKAMAARNSQVRQLWDTKLVGENHSGLLSVRGTLTPEQQKLVDAENADRTSLYAAEAKSKGTKADEVATAYYVARLGYAKAGAWFEKYNAANKQWEWKQWP